MLFVKNMIFIGSMIEHLAPDIDMLAEVREIALRFAVQHGQRIAEDSGVGLRAEDVDMTGFKASLGLESEVDSISFRQLRKRRELILKRMGGADV